MAATWIIHEYEICYDLDSITITKDNMYIHIIGSDNVLAFCEGTDDINDYVAIDTYFENNFNFTNEA
jgi:hypothetical protein